MVSLYGVSQSQWSPCMALFQIFVLGQPNLRYYNILGSWDRNTLVSLGEWKPRPEIGGADRGGIGTQWSPCMVVTKHSGLLVCFLFPVPNRWRGLPWSPVVGSEHSGLPAVWRLCGYYVASVVATQ